MTEKDLKLIEEASKIRLGHEYIASLIYLKPILRRQKIRWQIWNEMPLLDTSRHTVMYYKKEKICFTSQA